MGFKCLPYLVFAVPTKGKSGEITQGTLYLSAAFLSLHEAVEYADKQNKNPNFDYKYIVGNIENVG